jgi:hypothetical protein
MIVTARQLGRLVRTSGHAAAASPRARTLMHRSVVTRCRAARALREFAGMVIDNDDAVH